MKLEKNKFELIKRLWSHMGVLRRKQFKYVSILMVASSILEVISIGTLIPFINIIISQKEVNINNRIIQILSEINITSISHILLVISLLFIFSAIGSGFLKMLLLIKFNELSFGSGADIGTKIYKSYLYQPYKDHLIQNSSELIAGAGKVGTAVNMINQMLILISGGLVTLAITGFLIYTNYKITIPALLTCSLIYLLITYINGRKLKVNSKEISINQIKIIKIMQEGVGGIREILINNNQEYHIKKYSEVENKFKKAQAHNAYLSQYPKYLLETLGVVILAILAFKFNESTEGVNQSFAIIGALAYAAQRILPALQQSYSAWTFIEGHKNSLEDIINLLDKKIIKQIDNDQIIKFNKKMSLKLINFEYEKGFKILNNINLEIIKGSRIGIVGKTGGGKSTLLDIISGLQIPESGEIIIDGKLLDKSNIQLWQKNISYVSQHVHLNDESIAENIAYGIPKNEINMELVREVADDAQLTNFINQTDNGFETKIGERGVRLSGGQRQRIGIARALYKNTDLILLDEATSALDDQTESELMNTIYNMPKDKTIIIIAHRITTLKNCDSIIELENGTIKNN
jgi:ABC-type multidrug transport system fused ATPase/permease subunit